MIVCALMALSASAVALGSTGTYQSPRGNAIAASASLLFGSSTTASLNWAGYAVVPSSGKVSAVTESFVVPDPVVSSGSGHTNSINVQNKPGGNGHGPGGGGSSGGSSSTSYAAFWAGMDGFNSNTVEQAGILMNVTSSGTTTYAAWTEFYPALPTYAPASFTVGVGDAVTVTVSYSSTSNTITASVTDGSQTYSSSHSASSYLRSSAEWIAEAPSSGHSILPLADFGSVNFGPQYTGVSNTNYATIGTATGSIGSFIPSSTATVYLINMAQRNGALKASTGSLTDSGTSFTVTWKGS